MLNSLFSSLYSTMEGSVTLSGFLVSIFTALVLGALYICTAPIIPKASP